MIKHFLLLVALLVPATFIVQQQESNPSAGKGWGVPDGPLNCEMNRQNLEYLRALIRQQVSPNAVLVLVARLGNGEKQRELNHRRLYNVRLKLNTEFAVPKEKIVAAEGERVKGFGRVDFYLGGELVGTLLIHKQSDICVGCCGPDERFYPDKDGLKPKPKQRNR